MTNAVDIGAQRASASVSCRDCALRTRSAFAEKSEKEVDWTQKIKSGQRRVPANQDLIYAGQTDAELYTLYSGWAFRYQTLPDGRRQILNFFLPGDLIGFQATLMSAAEHSVMALSDVQVCVFRRAKFWRVFRDMPELAYQLAWLGAREEGMVDDNLTSVGQLDARERIAALVIGLYRRANYLGLVDADTFEFPLLREHISDALGLSIVHTTKTWSALRRAGLFEQKGARLHVLNPRLTARLASIYERDWRVRPIL